MSARAYSKVLLHAAKYPHRAVNGVLLVEKSKSKDVKTLKFVDAIPLFHLTLGLAPMMEVALTQVIMRGAQSGSERARVRAFLACLSSGCLVISGRFNFGPATRSGRSALISGCTICDRRSPRPSPPSSIHHVKCQ